MPSEWIWTAQREEAALLVAQDELTDAEISEKVGVARNGALARWKTHPVFRQRVKEHVEVWKAQFREEGLCVKERRIKKLVGMFQATETIVKERGEELAADADAAGKMPGGVATGYVVRDYKGKDATAEVFYFDAALVREQRAILDAIAGELGQKVEKHEHSGPGGKPIEVLDLSNLSDAELEKLHELQSKAAAGTQNDSR